MMILTRLTVFVASVMTVGMAVLTACVVWAAVPAGPGEPPQAQVAGQAEQSRRRRSGRYRHRRSPGAGPWRGRQRGREAGPRDRGQGRELRRSRSRGVTDRTATFDFAIRSPLLEGTCLMAGTADRARQGIYPYDFSLVEAETKQPVRIVLKPSREVVVRVTDPAGVPVPGAAVESGGVLCSVAIARRMSRGRRPCASPPTPAIQWIIGLKSGRGFDYFEHGEGCERRSGQGSPGAISISSSTGRGRSGSERSIAPASPSRGFASHPGICRSRASRRECLSPSRARSSGSVTDERGIATFDWLPPTTEPVYFLPTTEGYHTLRAHDLKKEARDDPHRAAVAGRDDPRPRGPARWEDRPPASWCWPRGADRDSTRSHAGFEPRPTGPTR